MDPFSVIQNIGTPIALVAFVVALAAYAYRWRLVERRKLIEAAPEADRAKLLDATIRDFTTVNTETLTREQRYQLALKLIEERAAKFRLLMVSGVFTALLLAVVIVVLPDPATGDEPVSLVVRLSDPAGRFITSGEVTVDAGEERETRPVGQDGQVRFDNVPRAVFASGVSVTPHVAGYASMPAKLTSVPEGGVYYLELTPAPTDVYGTVVDRGHAPLAGVVLSFDGGAAIDTTDANGTFRVSLAHPPGARIAVRASRGGVVGYNDTVTIPDGAALTLTYEIRE